MAAQPSINIKTLKIRLDKREQGTLNTPAITGDASLRYCKVAYIEQVTFYKVRETHGYV